MTGEDVRRALRSAAAPGELDAERRAWAVVRTAYGEAEIERPRRWASRPLLALAVALALVAAALTPPGRAVGGWMRETLGLERVQGREDARPALASLPASGRLLVVAGRSTWVVRGDGSKRRLGRYDEATWSPRGLHVALAHGPRLVAATPEGAVRWTLTKRGRVVAPSWSPSGFRVAYGLGGALRVVHGDGEPDRLVARGVVPGSWAWRPDADRNVIAFGLRGGGVRVLDVDGLETAWTRPDLGRVTELAWSRDGARLVAETESGGLVVLGRAGEVVRRIEVRPFAWALSPAGDAVAAVGDAGRARSRVVLVGLGEGAGRRVVFSGAGRFSDLEWSPNGRWLVVAWPSADQWLFLRMPDVGRVRAVSNIAREFDPGGMAPGGAGRTRFAGWCCPPEPD